MRICALYPVNQNLLFLNIYKALQLYVNITSTKKIIRSIKEVEIIFEECIISLNSYKKETK